MTPELEQFLRRAKQRFRFAGPVHTVPAAQVMVQQAHAMRVWDRLYPGKPAHFEVNGDTNDLSHQ